MKTFEDKSLQDFITKACAHLRKFYSDELIELSDEELRSFSERGIERARGYKLASEKDIIQFLSFSAVFGAEFPDTDNTQWARNILLSHYSGKQRINALHEHAQHVLRSEN